MTEQLQPSESTRLKRPRAPRNELDAYYTPPWPIRRLLQQAIGTELNVLCDAGGTVVEPCVGGGAIVEQLLDYGIRGTRIRASDIDLAAVERTRQRFGHTGLILQQLDALHLANRGISYRNTAFVTNPPFFHGFPLRLARALLEAEACMVVMLLRLSQLETPSRAAFFRTYPPHVYVLPERVDFTGAGPGDNTGHAWFVWRRGQSQAQLSWLTDEHVQPRLPLGAG